MLVSRVKEEVENMIRFSNLEYSHTDTFYNDESIVKLVADFNEKEMIQAGLEVNDSYMLVIEVLFLDGKVHRPIIWNLEDNEFIDTNDDEVYLIFEYLKNKLNKHLTIIK